MRKIALALCALTAIAQIPACAHVKWHLAAGQDELLAQPKPELFVYPMPENVAVVAAALIFLHAASCYAPRFRGWRLNQWLIAISERLEPLLSLALGLFTGLLLIRAADHGVLVAPNMPLSGWEWYGVLESLIGVGLIVGLLSRTCGAMLLVMLLGSFQIFPFGDALDLVTMYGVAGYFLLAGRGPLSLDGALGLAAEISAPARLIAYLLLRACTGAGLIVLGFDEKLLHPQFAMHVLEHNSTLNFMRAAGMSDQLFVLCAGAVEVLVGLVVLTGSFPRLGAIFLACLFTATALVSGECELFGHLPYYGVVAFLLLRGNGNFAVLRWSGLGGAVLPAVRRLVASRDVCAGALARIAGIRSLL